MDMYNSKLAFWLLFCNSNLTKVCFNIVHFTRSSLAKQLNGSVYVQARHVTTNLQTKYYQFYRFWVTPVDIHL